jgi:hypothetical protein
MTAWLLIFSLGGQGYMIQGIASEEGCKALVQKIRAELYAVTPQMKCIAYETVFPRPAD